jgi:muconolactone delta-isomerase
MTQRDLWDYLEESKRQEARHEQADRESARRKAIKQLRASGHWLTLLRVARTIPQPFTLNDISVAVWRTCPEFFGMKGYPYPDNHKVHYILYGDRGLIAKGLIQRVSQGLFRVPADLDVEAVGRQHAEENRHSSPDATEV